MAARPRPTSRRAALAAGCATFCLAAAAQAQDGYDLGTIYVQSYEEAILQALGVSEISAAQLEKTPVANDIAEIVRKMPGVNLTGASATGQRGNQRQIDIRGMGPENTLILIDGKPVLSRDAVKMGRGGERDTRGDSNWVPAEMIDRIEVIRGPAAARYGSGAAGGVVNIITKQPKTETFSVNMRYTQPESAEEGGDRRINFLWARPLSDSLTMRLIGSYNESDPDDPGINDDATPGCTDGDDSTDCDPEAGMEGVVNKDVSFRLSYAPGDVHRWDLDLGYSRQGNRYAGDTQLGSSSDTTEALAQAGAETNRMERYSFALTHTGSYAFGEERSYIQVEHTDNTRLAEGTAGGSEGRITDDLEWNRTQLDNITAKTEWIVPGKVAGRDAKYTFGAELRYETLYDPYSILRDLDFSYGETAPDPADRDDRMEQLLAGIYAEANILWTDRLTLTPSLRADYSDQFGGNLSGSVNATYRINDAWTAKVGIARAFKAPNLYQINPGYVYTTRGNGCPAPYYRQGPCYVLGNPDLDPETSWNKEIGIAYSGANGVSATLTAFHNSYHNKIQSGLDQVAEYTVGGDVRRVYRWENVPDAVVAGVEGNFAMPLGERLRLSSNLTWMLESENKSTGDPLSLVPDYTLNASLEWQATDRLTLIPSVTHYGAVEAARKSPTTGYEADDTDALPEYSIFNLASSYAVRDDVTFTAGVTNLLDKTVLRSGDGANTFNEPGRAFYLGLSTTF